MKYTAKPVTVEAKEIKDIADISHPGEPYVFVLSDDTTVEAKPEQCGAHTPTPGDFWIMRADGDCYLCPAHVFAEKYEAAKAEGIMAESSLDVSEKQAAAVAKTDNRVTLASIKAKIAEVEYFHPATVPHYTIAILRLENGYVVTGESAPADPLNFNEELGCKIALENATAKIWGLEGYLLRQKLAQPEPMMVMVDMGSEAGDVGVDGRG